ncbi:LOW QUALITY PROTEIN: deoxynucleoside kinase-like [Homalodisca vitripennis]|uniref:LOW QUALITY PROTEIN: deoxynucleoside kinase-like n=1 Tax=Homalodisca vitripennis TaxID=197043 RepID=UPI001EECA0D8|nr:LOW QUALITY PROTEIN: deoxynucleoside kinase-like [Homalodisca vitripennis]
MTTFALKYLGHYLVTSSLLKVRQISCLFVTFVNNSSTMDFKSSGGSRPFTVFVEGNIGSGKTTFLNHFSKYDAMILAEPVDLWRNVRGHNMLELMYNDQARWSLAFQTIVQKTMLDLHIRKTSKPIKMMERSIYSARYCFVENLLRNNVLAPPSYAVLDEWFQWIVKNFDTHGDLIVYLRTEPEVVYQRMKSRARTEEAQVPLEYLQQLHQMHDDWLLHKSVFSCPAPVIVIDANKELSDMMEEYERCESAMKTRGSIFTTKTCSPRKSASLFQSAVPQSPSKLVL